MSAGPPAAPDAWKVESLDGSLEITDTEGKRPLHAADERERIDALFLAAAAPRLYNALGFLVNRAEYLVETFSSRPHADRRLLQEAYAALIDARPREADVQRLMQRDRQLDLFKSAS